MKWASADVIRYHIVGVYQARTHIASDGSGQADVTDGLVIDLTWKLSESKLVAKPNANDMPTNTHTVEICADACARCERACEAASRM